MLSHYLVLLFDTPIAAYMPMYLATRAGKWVESNACSWVGGNSGAIRGPFWSRMSRVPTTRVVAAAVADDVRAAGNVDLGTVCRRRTVERCRTDVDPVATCMGGDQHRVRRPAVVALYSSEQRRLDGGSGVVAPAGLVPSRPRLSRGPVLDGRLVDGRETVRRRRRRHLRAVNK